MNRCLRCDGVLQGGEPVIPVEQVTSRTFTADVVAGLIERLIEAESEVERLQGQLDAAPTGQENEG